MTNLGGKELNGLGCDGGMDLFPIDARQIATKWKGGSLGRETRVQESVMRDSSRQNLQSYRRVQRGKALCIRIRRYDRIARADDNADWNANVFEVVPCERFS